MNKGLPTSLYIQYGDARIPYNLVRRKRKTVGITVSLESGVQVAAPLRISEKQIQDIVSQKARWIFTKLSAMEQLRNAVPQRRFEPGEVFAYLGRDYILQVSRQPGIRSAKAALVDGVLAVVVPLKVPVAEQPQAVCEAITGWYRDRAREFIAARMQHYSAEIGASPSKIVIKTQKRRWGSCTASGVININWKIIMAPVAVIDYIVVHELAHLKVRNHSKSFWSLVESIMPDYRVHSRWLKNNGIKLDL